MKFPRLPLVAVALVVVVAAFAPVADAGFVPVTPQAVQNATAQLSSSLSVNGQKIVSVGSPAIATDVATKGYVDTAAAGVVGLGLFANRPVSGTVVGARYSSDPGGEFVWDGSVWRPLVQGIKGYQPPSAATFTAVNAGTGTLTDSVGTLLLAGQTDGSLTLRGFSLPITPANGNFIAAAFSLHTTTQEVASFCHVGVGFRRVADAHAYFAEVSLFNNSTGLTTGLAFSQWTANTTRSAAGNFNVDNLGNGPTFLRARRDATQLYVDVSRDYLTWNNLQTVALATVFPTAAPDTVMIYSSGDASAGAIPMARFVSLQYQ